MCNQCNYDDGYAFGFDDGKQAGYEEGHRDTVEMYEKRIANLWMELKTLAARVDYLEKHVGI